LDSEKGEEAIQRFLTENPVLLHIFNPIKIIPKAPLLNKQVSDFVLISPQKELLLVEIEKPGLRLLKKDGGVAAPLQHAFDQVNSWLGILEEHRLAALECMNLDRSEVASIRGVVIAGRRKGIPTTHLKALR